MKVLMARPVGYLTSLRIAAGLCDRAHPIHTEDRSIMIKHGYRCCRVCYEESKGSEKRRVPGMCGNNLHPKTSKGRCRLCDRDRERNNRARARYRFGRALLSYRAPAPPLEVRENAKCSPEVAHLFEASEHKLTVSAVDNSKTSASARTERARILGAIDQYCVECPVMLQCGKHADDHEQLGVWGGVYRAPEYYTVRAAMKKSATEPTLGETA